MTSLITTDLVRLGAGWGSDKHDVIRALADVVDDAGRATSKDQLVADAFAREETSATGLPGGIAIPHCRTSGVEVPTLAFARLEPPVDFGAKDGPADLAFLIAAPAGGDADHLTILTKLARALVKPAFTDALRSAGSAEEVVDLVAHELGEPAPAAKAAVPASGAPSGAATPGGAETTDPAQASTGTPSDGGAGADPAATSAAAPAGTTSLVAVTSCPTGIAHTYMAAEALEAAAERAGVPLQVETQGSAGSTPLSPDTIAAAGAVIFAVDVGVRDRSRFAGKPMVTSGVKRPIDDADAMIAEALRYAADPASAPRVEGEAGGASEGTGSAGQETWGGRTRRVLMTGVSYMIPFVAAGGLMIALGFLLSGYEIVDHARDILLENSFTNLPDASAIGLDHALLGSDFLAYIGALLLIIGQTAFAFFIPALAGYIAYAIADRPGIAPGFVMGGLASNVLQVSGDSPYPATGFIGAIVGGVLAGLIAHWLAGRKVPAWARGLMPVLVIPLVTSIVAGFLMLVVFGRPIAWLMGQLEDGLNSLSGGSAVLLGVILGLMMAFDMGGPLNKVAYSFAAAGVGGAALTTDAPELRIMAAVMLAGMVPPIALALATVLRPGLFSAAERENGKAGWLLGASFITEGAIPFAAADPLRVIPAIMAGSAVTGGLSMAMDVGVRAPHGGIFVLFAVDGVLGYLIALAAGVVVGAVLVILLKSMGRRDADVATV
ncbi:fructose-specific PTS transporter subunit EIIC [Nocardioides sp. zg-1228]|uniref:PTS fructose transporter subunit IIABC n=1 Tax=Nocardioides sp. zg-1228 TaxID=2763008 RepID=UPI001642FB66|nr:fructose-specific PTS transporter subunit EIIC [Nocardioides sp. zg-1228]MBC2933417.1 PTS sugar transporter subunit IIA [Nocardioides sp. zg-1228]QSF56433.1 PTS sugar transporter subunit IIA [Nocardioides sp. zg-1228]